MGAAAVLISFKGALVTIKCPELPVSGIKVVVGGVQATVSTHLVLSKLRLFAAAAAPNLQE